ncbi:hypothetical protein SDJN03_01865, partial [Cucurbita argyrosperma subsp. sororia]
MSWLRWSSTDSSPHRSVHLHGGCRPIRRPPNCHCLSSASIEIRGFHHLNSLLSILFTGRCYTGYELVSNLEGSGTYWHTDQGKYHV